MGKHLKPLVSAPATALKKSRTGLKIRPACIKAVRTNGTFDVSSTLIKDFTVHAHPDVVFRIFDKDVVLANHLMHPFTFYLAKVAPGIKLPWLQGTASQDMVTNNGQTVGENIILAEREGLFLQFDDNSINKRL